MLMRHRVCCFPVRFGIGLIVVALATPAPAAPAFYSGAEIRGWVVDAETKRPLEGVHVVAQWRLYSGWIHRGRWTPLQVFEVMTDLKGQYHFPAWGPKPRPFLSSLDDLGPLLIYFRPGYRMLTRSNNTPSDESRRASTWDGKPIEIEPFRGTPEEWVRQLSLVQGYLAWGDPTDHPIRQINDYWKYTPRIVLAVIEQRQLLPSPLRARVLDLDVWQATERQVRAVRKEEGVTP